jgi:hypothetical protein|tara:strand:+ start:718 stop:924 length:207 start_codon:yes stop_codon:yes gene_type:complete
MKSKQFKMGEHSPQPLDIEMFKYECINVLGMKDVEEDEFHQLAQYLLEHYYSIKVSDRQNLRYSVVEA